VDIVDRQSGEVIDISKATNDQLAIHYRSLQSETSRIRVELYCIKQEFNHRASETDTQMLVSDNFEIRKTKRVKSYDADIIKSRLGEFLTPSQMNEVITIPQPKEVVNGNRLSAYARKFGGVVKQAYEDSKLDFYENWKVTEK
jgi:hypothetical protein